jgi:ATP-dependent DNA helicase RecG
MISSPDATQVLAWVARNEGQTIEFKPENVPQAELSEAIAGFANADGGVILIGVRDNQALAGVADVKGIIFRVYAAARTITPRLDEAIQVDEVPVEGQRIVVVQDPDDCMGTYLAGSSYRIRQGAKNVLMSAQAVAEHVRLRGALPFDQQQLPGTSAADLDEARLRAFLRQRPGDLHNGVDLAAPAVRDRLRNLHILGEEAQGVHLTVAGLLMFGREPQRWLPQAVLQCARFLGTGVSRFLDRTELMGTIDQQIEVGMDFIARNIRHGTYIARVRHVDVVEYPLPALREALINALCHRDYYAQGTAVNLSIFDDRIEVLNPGGLLPGLRPQALEGQHRLRNTALGQLMYEAGLIERWGSGIRRMRLSMEEVGLPPPVIEADRDWFRIVFHGPGEQFLATPAVPAPTTLGETAAALNQLNPRQRRLLADLQTRGSITSTQYEQEYGVARVTAYRDLTELVRLGLLRREGMSRASRYVLVREDRSPG